MRSRTMVAMGVLALLATAPAARAQAPCSLQTVTGSYAFQSTNWSAVGEVFTVPPVGQVYSLFGHDYVIVGTATIAADGSGTGVYWGVLGATPTPLTGVPAQFTVTIHQDCTGELIAPGGASEKLVVLRNGAEIRTISGKARPLA